jgi:hypothetical protein
MVPGCSGSKYPWACWSELPWGTHLIQFLCLGWNFQECSGMFREWVYVSFQVRATLGSLSKSVLMFHCIIFKTVLCDVPWVEANIINYGLFHVNYDVQLLRDKNYKLLLHKPQTFTASNVIIGIEVHIGSV